MIVVFTGYTSAGKTTYENDFLKEYKSFKKAMAYTTRPKRKEEINGLDYFFVNEKEFDFLINEGKIFLPRTYKVFQDNKEKLWKYGIEKNISLTTSFYTTILDANGVLELSKEIGRENIVVVYLEAPEKVLFERAAARGDEKKEFLRRLSSDREEFIKIKNNIDLILHSDIPEEKRLDQLKLIKKFTEDV